jgi:hypothetical protein
MEWSRSWGRVISLKIKIRHSTTSVLGMVCILARATWAYDKQSGSSVAEVELVEATRACEVSFIPVVKVIAGPLLGLGSLFFLCYIGNHTTSAKHLDFKEVMCEVHCCC